MAASLTALILVVYAPALRGAFLNWDDDRYLTNNPLWHGSIAAYLSAGFTRIQFEAYHPLHLFSYLPDRLLWSNHPAGFHLLNALLFAGALFWLWSVLRRRASGPAAFLAVALLGLHPFLTESVAWITGRKEVLALLLVVAALWWEDTDPRSPRFSPLALALAVAAYLTKSATVVLPLVVFAWHRWVRDDSVRTAILRALPLAVPALIVAVVVTNVWSSHQMILPARPLPVVWDVPGTVAFYVAGVAWPAGLSPAYPPVFAWQRAGAIALLLGAAALVASWSRLPGSARFAVVAFVGALLPVSNVIPLYFRFADRYVLFALAMLAWPAACAIDWVVARLGRWALIVPGLLLCGEAVATQRLAGAWRDSLSLWTRATSAQPGALFGHVKLGETLRQARRWNDAVDAYVGAVRADRRSMLGYVGLFTALAEEAEETGRVSAGAPEIWSGWVAAGARTREGLEEVAARIDQAGCPPCSRSLTWLSLALYPRSDGELVAAARAEIVAGRPRNALVLLLAVVDRSNPGFREAYLDARRAGGPFRFD